MLSATLHSSEMMKRQDERERSSSQHESDQSRPTPPTTRPTRRTRAAPAAAAAAGGVGDSAGDAAPAHGHICQDCEATDCAHYINRHSLTSLHQLCNLAVCAERDEFNVLGMFLCGIMCFEVLLS